ncbi:MAG: TrkA family potassium uptake protein [Lachnospiraceae bacterium]|nr:TrkA family potassium uptake protein [Lachnospiraceae bacterium]
MKQSVAVLGLGKYGKSIAETLYELGADVLVVDIKEDLIEDFSGKVTSAVCADLTNEEETVALNLSQMDIVVVAMGGNTAASIMAVAVAKEQGVPRVVAKASSDRMASLLKKVGADKIIDPEEEGGKRSAHILFSDMILDFLQMDENLYMIEMKPQSAWIGKNLIELDLRKHHNINVVAMRKHGARWGFVDPAVKLEKDSSLLAVMEKKDVDRIARGKENKHAKG